MDNLNRNKYLPGQIPQNSHSNPSTHYSVTQRCGDTGHTQTQNDPYHLTASCDYSQIWPAQQTAQPRTYNPVFDPRNYNASGLDHQQLNISSRCTYQESLSRIVLPNTQQNQQSIIQEINAENKFETNPLTYANINHVYNPYHHHRLLSNHDYCSSSSDLFARGTVDGSQGIVSRDDTVHKIASNVRYIPKDLSRAYAPKSFNESHHPNPSCCGPPSSTVYNHEFYQNHQRLLEKSKVASTGYTSHQKLFERPKLTHSEYINHQKILDRSKLHNSEYMYNKYGDVLSHYEDLAQNYNTRTINHYINSDQKSYANMQKSLYNRSQHFIPQIQQHSKVTTNPYDANRIPYPKTCYEGLLTNHKIYQDYQQKSNSVIMKPENLHPSVIVSRPVDNSLTYSNRLQKHCREQTYSKTPVVLNHNNNSYSSPVTPNMRCMEIKQAHYEDNYGPKYPKQDIYYNPRQPQYIYPSTIYSPNVISPTDSNVSDSSSTKQYLLDECSYVSRCSTSSSIGSVLNHDSEFKNPAKCSGKRNISEGIVKDNYASDVENFINTSIVKRTSDNDKDKLDLRKFLSTWDETDDEVINQDVEKNEDNINSNEQLYILEYTDISSEDLDKYKHITQVTELPENIHGFTSVTNDHNISVTQYTPNDHNISITQYTPNVQNDNNFVHDINANNHNNVKKDSEMQCSKINKKNIEKTDHKVSIITSKNNINGVNQQCNNLHKVANTAKCHDDYKIIEKPPSPVDIETILSQSVISKEAISCSFDIKPCDSTQKQFSVHISHTDIQPNNVDLKNTTDIGVQTLFEQNIEKLNTACHIAPFSKQSIWSCNNTEEYTKPIITNCDFYQQNNKTISTFHGINADMSTNCENSRTLINRSRFCEQEKSILTDCMYSHSSAKDFSTTTINAFPSEKHNVLLSDFNKINFCKDTCKIEPKSEAIKNGDETIANGKSCGTVNEILLPDITSNSSLRKNFIFDSNQQNNIKQTKPYGENKFEILSDVMITNQDKEHLLKNFSYQDPLTINLNTKPFNTEIDSKSDEAKNIIFTDSHGSNDCNAKNKIVKEYKEIYSINQNHVETNNITCNTINHVDDQQYTNQDHRINSQETPCELSLTKSFENSIYSNEQSMEISKANANGSKNDHNQTNQISDNYSCKVLSDNNIKMIFVKDKKSKDLNLQNDFQKENFLIDVHCDTNKNTTVPAEHNTKNKSEQDISNSNFLSEKELSISSENTDIVTLNNEIIEDDITTKFIAEENKIDTFEDSKISAKNTITTLVEELNTSCDKFNNNSYYNIDKSFSIEVSSYTKSDNNFIELTSNKEGNSNDSHSSKVNNANNEKESCIIPVNGGMLENECSNSLEIKEIVDKIETNNCEDKTSHITIDIDNNDLKVFENLQHTKVTSFASISSTVQTKEQSVDLQNKSYEQNNCFDQTNLLSIKLNSTIISRKDAIDDVQSDEVNNLENSFCNNPNLTDKENIQFEAVTETKYLSKDLVEEYYENTENNSPAGANESLSNNGESEYENINQEMQTALNSSCINKCKESENHLQKSEKEVYVNNNAEKEYNITSDASDKFDCKNLSNDQDNAPEYINNNQKKMHKKKKNNFSIRLQKYSQRTNNSHIFASSDDSQMLSIKARRVQKLMMTFKLKRNRYKNMYKIMQLNKQNNAKILHKDNKMFLTKLSENNFEQENYNFTENNVSIHEDEKLSGTNLELPLYSKISKMCLDNINNSFEVNKESVEDVIRIYKLESVKNIPTIELKENLIVDKFNKPKNLDLNTIEVNSEKRLNAKIGNDVLLDKNDSERFEHFDISTSSSERPLTTSNNFSKLSLSELCLKENVQNDFGTNCILSRIEENKKFIENIHNKPEHIEITYNEKENQCNAKGNEDNVCDIYDSLANAEINTCDNLHSDERNDSPSISYNEEINRIDFCDSLCPGECKDSSFDSRSEEINQKHSCNILHSIEKNDSLFNSSNEEIIQINTCDSSRSDETNDIFSNPCIKQINTCNGSLHSEKMNDSSSNPYNEEVSQINSCCDSLHSDGRNKDGCEKIVVHEAIEHISDTKETVFELVHFSCDPDPGKNFSDIEQQCLDDLPGLLLGKADEITEQQLRMVLIDKSQVEISDSFEIDTNMADGKNFSGNNYFLFIYNSDNESLSTDRTNLGIVGDVNTTVKQCDLGDLSLLSYEHEKDLQEKSVFDNPQDISIIEKNADHVDQAVISSDVEDEFSLNNFPFVEEIVYDKNTAVNSEDSCTDSQNDFNETISSGEEAVTFEMENANKEILNNCIINTKKSELQDDIASQINLEQSAASFKNVNNFHTNNTKSSMHTKHVHKALNECIDKSNAFRTSNFTDFFFKDDLSYNSDDIIFNKSLKFSKIDNIQDILQKVKKHNFRSVKVVNQNTKEIIEYRSIEKFSHNNINDNIINNKDNSNDNCTMHSTVRATDILKHLNCDKKDAVNSKIVSIRDRRSELEDEMYQNQNRGSNYNITENKMDIAFNKVNQVLDNIQSSPPKISNSIQTSNNLKNFDVSEIIVNATKLVNDRKLTDPEQCTEIFNNDSYEKFYKNKYIYIDPKKIEHDFNSNLNNVIENKYNDSTGVAKNSSVETNPNYEFFDMIFQKLLNDRYKVKRKIKLNEKLNLNYKEIDEKQRKSTPTLEIQNKFETKDRLDQRYIGGSVRTHSGSCFYDKNYSPRKHTYSTTEPVHCNKKITLLDDISKNLKVRRDSAEDNSLYHISKEEKKAPKIETNFGNTNEELKLESRNIISLMTDEERQCHYDVKNYFLHLPKLNILETESRNITSISEDDCNAVCDSNIKNEKRPMKIKFQDNCPNLSKRKFKQRRDSKDIIQRRHSICAIYNREEYRNKNKKRKRYHSEKNNKSVEKYMVMDSRKYKDSLNENFKSFIKKQLVEDDLNKNEDSSKNNENCQDDKLLERYIHCDSLGTEISPTSFSRHFDKKDGGKVINNLEFSKDYYYLNKTYSNLPHETYFVSNHITNRKSISLNKKPYEKYEYLGDASEFFRKNSHPTHKDIQFSVCSSFQDSDLSITKEVESNKVGSPNIKEMHDEKYTNNNNNRIVNNNKFDSKFLLPNQKYEIKSDIDKNSKLQSGDIIVTPRQTKLHDSNKYTYKHKTNLLDKFKSESYDHFTNDQAKQTTTLKDDHICDSLGVKNEEEHFKVNSKAFIASKRKRKSCDNSELVKNEIIEPKQFSNELYSKSRKRNFDDTLTSIDKQYQSKHSKKKYIDKHIIPKLIIKRDNHGVHYASEKESNFDNVSKIVDKKEILSAISLSKNENLSNKNNIITNLDFIEPTPIKLRISKGDLKKANTDVPKAREDTISEINFSSNPRCISQTRLKVHESKLKIEEINSKLRNTNLKLEAFSNFSTLCVNLEKRDDINYLCGIPDCKVRILSNDKVVINGVRNLKKNGNKNLNTEGF